MAVQFILGKNPHIKREKTITKIYELLKQDEELKILYLIPDNVKYETETMILDYFKQLSPRHKKQSGMIRLQVFSFSRLAWYLLQDKPIYQQSQLSESGLSMLMKKILQKEEENLTIFRGASHEEGFVQRLVSLFSELRNGKIIPSDLEEMISEEKQEDDDFKYKMQDLSLIYKEYNQLLKGKYIEQEDLYVELINYIKKQPDTFKNTVIFVDHYEHFSAQEQELITTLAKHVNHLYINLTLDSSTNLELNDLNNLFYRPLKTYHQLKEVLQKDKIAVLDDIYIDEEILNQSEINKLQNYWIDSNHQLSLNKVDEYKTNKYDDIEIWTADNSYAEIMHVATKIKQMVAKGTYRYCDFQVLSRNLESYNLNIETIFEENEIPFFIDQAESMSQHPLLELITSLFNLKKRYYRLDDIFRFFRTELFIPEFPNDFTETMDEDSAFEKLNEVIHSWRQKLDIAENVALAQGYEGKDWIDGREWVYGEIDIENNFHQDNYEAEILKKSIEVKDVFQQSIVPFLEGLEDLEKNTQVAKSLYEFLMDIGVASQLQYWRDELIAKGELEEARKHEQAWQTFIELLDEFVEVLGDENWDLDSFLSILETGFEQATYSMVPPTIDQVLVANYDLPKIQSRKVVFMVGLTDTQLPFIQSNQSLLTDEDRGIVESHLSSEKYLAVSEMESTANEPFAFYLAILQASEKIYLSYPVGDEENSENRISPYLSRIQSGLNIQPILKHGNAISETIDSFDKYIDYIGSSQQSFNQIILSLRYSLDHGVAPSLFWLGLFKKIYSPENYIQKRIVSSLSHKNIPVPLTEELTEKLYGKDLYLSVSQLETFYADPYSHFLLYGLRLRERQIQELTPLETGNFYHDALDLISKQMATLNKDISELTKKEVQKITAEVCYWLMDTNKYRLAHSSHRMHFIFTQLTKTVGNLVESMIKQSRRSKFRMKKTELVFGQLGNEEAIPGLTFPLTENRKIHLRGKIDRIDTFQDGNDLYAGIVDYKSSDVRFDYQNIYYGLMLQMITYLDTVLTYSENIFDKKADKIGAFYSTVKNPVVNLQDIKRDQLDIEILKEYKMDGLIIDNPLILEAADTLLQPREQSPLYNLRRLVSEKHSSNRILSDEEFDLLLQFNRDKIIEAGQQIIKGTNMLRPFDKRKIKNTFTPAIDGPYRAISQFDALLPENNYQEVNKINKKQFFEFLKEKYSNN